MIRVFGALNTKKRSRQIVLRNKLNTSNPKIYHSYELPMTLHTYAIPVLIHVLLCRYGDVKCAK